MLLRNFSICLHPPLGLKFHPADLNLRTPTRTLTLTARRQSVRRYVSEAATAPVSEGTEKRQRQPHRIHVLGVDSSCGVGKYIAHSLRRRNRKCKTSQPVTLIFRRPDRAAEFVKAGKTLETIKQQNETASTISSGFRCEVLPPPNHVQIGAISKPTQGFIKHLIILPNEDESIPQALGRMKERLDSRSSILFLQDPNVFRTMDEVSARVFSDPVTRPVYWAGFSEHDLGMHPATSWSVFHYASKSIRIGPMYQDQPAGEEGKSPIIPDENSMVQRLKATHALQTRVLSHDEITVLMLCKLAVEAVIQPLAAIFRCRFWDLVTHPIRQRIIRDMIIQEVGPIIRRLHKPTLSPDMRQRQPVARRADAHLSDGGTQQLQNYALSSSNLVNLAIKACKKNSELETTGMRLKVEAQMNLDEIENITSWFAAKAEDLKLGAQYSSTLGRLVKQRQAVTGDMVGALFPRIYAVADNERNEPGGRRKITRVGFQG